MTPAFIEADPSGQYLFGQYERHVVAIDIRTATVVADLTTTGVASIAFDPETRLLVVAAREIPDHPRVVLKTFSVSANGATTRCSCGWPRRQPLENRDALVA